MLYFSRAINILPVKYCIVPHLSIFNSIKILHYTVYDNCTNYMYRIVQLCGEENIGEFGESMVIH